MKFVMVDSEGAQGVGQRDDDGRPQEARAGDEVVSYGQPGDRVVVLVER